MNYIKFNDLVNDINSIVTQKVEIIKHSGGRHVGIKFVDKPVPISINESEYNFMYQTIVNNNLKVGYELSTGVGISTIAISQAFKFTGGHLISLDSYYEEITHVSNNIPIGNYTYKDKQKVAEISNSYNIIGPIDVDQYFKKEIDERIIQNSFNHVLIKDTLRKISIFTNTEFDFLINLQEKFTLNASKLSKSEYKNELERLAIDLSWKSSQIEGNTYSLLETERLLKDKETAAGKTKEEASMLLNHKEALDFIINQPDYIYPLKVSSIEIKFIWIFIFGIFSSSM